MENIIRIFVGTPANNEDLESQAVLEYSLRKHASQPVEITWMKLSKDPNSFWYSDAQKKAGWLTQGWATPFSGFRWSIPAFCQFQGRAIYLDIDMMIMADIAELWRTPINDSAICVAKDRERFCCTLFDCERARKALPPIERIKREFALYSRLRQMLPPGAVQQFSNGDWNCLDGEGYHSICDPKIKIVHCTSIPHQPQLRYALPRLAAKNQKHWSNQRAEVHWRRDIIDLFDELLAEAKSEGYSPEKYETEETFGKYYR